VTDVTPPSTLGTRVLLTLTTVGIVVVSLWATLGLTLMPTVKADDSWWLVNRTPWVQGDAPIGERVVVQSTAVDSGIVARAELLIGGGDNIVATIAASPQVGRSEGGTVIVSTPESGTTTYKLPDSVTWTPADGTYLVLCGAESACGPAGTVQAVPVENVLGRAARALG